MRVGWINGGRWHSRDAGHGVFKGGRFDHFIRLSSPGTDLDLADEALRRLGCLTARTATRAV